jgi:hypothetical protein
LKAKLATAAAFLPKTAAWTMLRARAARLELIRCPTLIVNGDEDTWEDTDPAGFTDWMKQKNDLTGGNLKRVIRLFKYLRDHQDHFKLTRSVLLTASEAAAPSRRHGQSTPVEDPAGNVGDTGGKHRQRC